MAWANEFKNLTNEIFTMHGDRAKYIHHLTSGIQQMMNDYKTARADMKKDLLAIFRAWEETRNKEVGDLLAAFREGDRARAREIGELKAAIAKMIADFRKDREEAAAAWSNLIRKISRGEKKTEEAEEEVKVEKKTKKKKKKSG